jgi:hypothetical protein
MQHTQLRYAPVAENGPRFAADIVSIVREGSGVRLDYSAQSLWVLDDVIEGIRQEAPPHEAVVETLVGFGTYVGEVLVRETGGVWEDFDASYGDTHGHTFGVRTSDGRMWDPVARVFRRYVNGPGDSLYQVFQEVAGHLPG